MVRRGRVIGAAKSAWNRSGVAVTGQENDVIEFLSQDEREQVPHQYLTAIRRHLVEERDDLLKELKEFHVNIDHIKTIISTQQAFARSGGAEELISPRELIE